MSGEIFSFRSFYRYPIGVGHYYRCQSFFTLSFGPPSQTLKCSEESSVYDLGLETLLIKRNLKEGCRIGIWFKGTVKFILFPS